MIQTCLIALCALAPTPSDAVRFSARLDAQSLKKGDTAKIVVTCDLNEGLSAADAGIPAPLIQLDLPRCVKLEGKEITGYQALARNEFLEEPYERLLKNSPASIPFKLTRKPRKNDRIGINLVAYVGSADDAFFVRRRLELPLTPGAVAQASSETKSDWGKTKTLQVGDKVKKFKLPTADGREIALADYLGDGNVIVTTYRAFW